MKSRLITALAIGALTIGMVPGVASAAGPDNAEGSTTDVTVYVDAGTMFYAPAAFEVNASGNVADIPGVTVTSGSQTIEYLSNEPLNLILVDMTTTLTKGLDSIPDGNVKVLDADNADVLLGNFGSGPVEIDVVTGNTGNDVEEDSFKLQVKLPATPSGTYVGELTFTSIAD
jgi:hypothetical protein